MKPGDRVRKSGYQSVGAGMSRVPSDPTGNQLYGFQKGFPSKAFRSTVMVANRANSPFRTNRPPNGRFFPSSLRVAVRIFLLPDKKLPLPLRGNGT